MFSILVLIFMSVSQIRMSSLLTGSYDPNSTALINNRRDVKEIDVLRQIINQETLIRLAVVKDVRAAVDDVNSVRRRLTSTESTVSSLQRALNGLKVQVDSLTQDKNLAKKVKTLQREVNTLSRQNQILTLKIENLEREVEINKTNSLQQTVETLQIQVDSLSQEQKRKIQKITMDCENKVQETEQKFNRNIAEIYVLFKNNTLQTVKKETKINMDCQDHFLQGHKQSGVYSINPFGNETRVHVYCEMETEGGGWTAIQKRMSGSVRFYRKWVEYKNGFGYANESYWIGNDVIHQLTKGRNSSLYVSIILRDGTTLYELYQQFSVSDETNNYRLFLGGPATGTLGDSLLDTGDSTRDLSGIYFSTPDRDNDRNRNVCAALYDGGWWFNSCHRAFLNGPWSPAFWSSPWYPTVRSGTSIRETIMLIKRH